MLILILNKKIVFRQDCAFTILRMGHICSTSHFSPIKKSPYQLGCYNTLRWNTFPETNSLAYGLTFQLQRKCDAVNTIFFVTYKWTRRVFVPGRTFQPSVIFASQDRVYPSAPLLGMLLALPANITLSLEGLPRTNTLAYLVYS